MSPDKISIVIPCYNAAAFIAETLDSVLLQDHRDLEVIVMDDGSSDQSKAIISSYQDARIQYHYQNNQGVSAARNNGLQRTSGSYIVFLDADDKLEPRFLSLRLEQLRQDPALSFVCGEVRNFNEKGFVGDIFRGTSDEAAREVLLYYPMVTTCPSNYMFRKEFLMRHDLRFSPSLSSTADKLFVLQCAAKGRSTVIRGEGRLLYRVSENSMSHKLTEKLVKDNEQYYRQLMALGLIPGELRRRALFSGFMILLASYLKIGKPVKAAGYGLRAIFCSPSLFVERMAGI